MNKLIKLAALMFGLTLALGSNAAPRVVEVNIEQSRGIDDDVDYAALTRFGPWDDRNYQLNKEDLDFLSKDEASARDPIPAFYRVEFRKANPGMTDRGPRQYPRSALNKFLMQHDGYQINGRTYRALRDLGDFRYELYTEDEFEELEAGNQPNFLSGEKRITTPAGAAESAIAINPVDSNRVIAGTNGPGSGQKMWHSADGGTTWSGPVALSGTCCDPTVGWSADGTIAYTASLGSTDVRAYRSTNNGVSWGSPVIINSGGGTNDKEFIHVDLFPTSPHKDNIYVAFHLNNVQKFSRSTDKGLTYSPAVTIDSGQSGIGSDITTDAAGNVYYFFPGGTPAQIRVVKSTTGGASFPAGTTVANTDGDYEFALPSMETRKVFIYVAADTDLSGGPFHNSLYVAYADAIGTTTTNPVNNHGRVRVAYSRNGGTSWTVTTPHPTTDGATVDRYQPWMKVDATGRVHVIYYDTQHSVGRSGVDLYYAYSADGAVTWSTPTRVTAVTSKNIGNSFEWGDYQGMDMVLNDAIAIYTDNRDESGGTIESVDVYAAAGFAPPAGPDYTMGATPVSQNVCAGAALAATTVNLRALSGYNRPVSLDTPGFDTAVFNGTPSFTQATVTPTAAPGVNSTLSATTRPSAPTGNYTLSIRGRDNQAAPLTHTASIGVRVFNGTPTTATLTAPANSATGINVTPTLTWAAVANAQSYIVEVSSSPTFATIAQTGTPTTNSYALATALAPNTQYYWRVRAVSPCATGANSGTFSFSTENAICANPNLAIPDNNLTGASNDLVVATAGLLTDLNLSFKVTHPYVGDLQARLTHVASGTAIMVMTQPSAGSCANPDIDATLDDEAAALVHNQCAASVPSISGSFRPSNALTGMDGRALNGTWRLTLMDRGPQDIGTLTQWCLKPTVSNDLIFANGFQ